MSAMWLPLLISLGSTAFLGLLWIRALRKLSDVETERDALWDELHGIKR